MKRTLKRELKVLETVRKEAIERSEHTTPARRPLRVLKRAGGLRLEGEVIINGAGVIAKGAVRKVGRGLQPLSL